MFSEMQSKFDAFLSIESSASSVLSMYSTSGLFKESQVDIDSSIEREHESDLSGDTFMLYETGAAIGLDSTTSLFGKDVALPIATMLCFTEEVGGRVAPEKFAFVEVEDPFLMLTIFVEHGTYRIQISPSNQHLFFILLQSIWSL